MPRLEPKDQDVWIILHPHGGMRIFLEEDEARDCLTRKDLLYRARLANWEVQ